MNYKDWLQKTLSDMLKARDERINLQVYEHSNAKFTGGVHDCSIIINDLGGSTDTDDIVVLPIQLMCLSCGQLDENNEENTTYDILGEFNPISTIRYTNTTINKQVIIENKSFSEISQRIHKAQLIDTNRLMPNSPIEIAPPDE